MALQRTAKGKRAVFAMVSISDRFYRWVLCHWQIRFYGRRAYICVGSEPGCASARCKGLPGSECLDSRRIFVDGKLFSVVPWPQLSAQVR